MCTNSRAINKITIRHRLPLPQMDNIMDCLSGATYFSKIDLKSGYRQIPIREVDEWKATFKTNEGLYEWLVMPFRVSNAPKNKLKMDPEKIAVIVNWPSPKSLFEVRYDASGTAIGAVLSQEDKPIAFFSEKLNESRQANKVADALSRRALLLQESTIKVLGFEHLKDLYQIDTDFKEAYEACQNPLVRDNSPWLDYNLQEKLLFRRGQLCIPNCSMRENIIREKHSGDLAGHFGIEKTLEQLNHFYYWPKM
eukprot:PITA_22754